MNIYNLKQASRYEIKQWLEKDMELTPYQKDKIYDVIDESPFYFMKRTEIVPNVWMRFSAIFLLPVLLLILIGMPFNFLITGRWGYGENMQWYSVWVKKCGL